MKSVDDKREAPIHKAKRVYPASAPKKNRKPNARAFDFLSQTLRFSRRSGR
jgi:hypothetical protein